MTQHRSEWVAYLIGAILTLAFKYAKYLYVGRQKGQTMGGRPWNAVDATLEWCFDPTATNMVSWVTTIGVVWVFGSAYINDLNWLFGGYIQSIPLDHGIAFLLGSLMEIIAPAAVKWICSKIPFASGG